MDCQRKNNERDINSKSWTIEEGKFGFLTLRASGGMKERGDDGENYFET